MIKPIGYIASNDIFMSGWGQSENKTNVCYVPVFSEAEADLVEWYLHQRRTDQVKIRFVLSMPKDTATRKCSDLTSWPSGRKPRAFG